MVENSNYQHLPNYINIFNQPFAEAHNATADVEATTRCFLELIKREVFTKEELDVTPEYQTFRENNPEIQLIGLKTSTSKKLRMKSE